jgi:hypothetical protein
LGAGVVISGFFVGGTVPIVLDCRRGIKFQRIFFAFRAAIMLPVRGQNGTFVRDVGPGGGAAGPAARPWEKLRRPLGKACDNAVRRRDETAGQPGCSLTSLTTTTHHDRRRG